MAEEQKTAVADEPMIPEGEDWKPRPKIKRCPWCGLLVPDQEVCTECGCRLHLDCWHCKTPLPRKFGYSCPACGAPIAVGRPWWAFWRLNVKKPYEPSKKETEELARQRAVEAGADEISTTPAPKATTNPAKKGFWLRLWGIIAWPFHFAWRHKVISIILIVVLAISAFLGTDYLMDGGGKKSGQPTYQQYPVKR